MKVHDNFLNKTYHQEILNLMSGPSFAWLYSGNVNLPGKTADANDDLDEYGFSHPFWEYPDGMRTVHTTFILPFLYKIIDVIGTTDILRSRGDMTMYSSVGYKHKNHTDFDFPNIANAGTKAPDGKVYNLLTNKWEQLSTYWKEKTTIIEFGSVT